MNSRVLEIKDECKGVKTFRLEVPGDFSFKPGMWVMAALPGHPERAYTISTSPFEKGAIEITLNKAVSLKVGDVLMLRGPYGKWFFHDEERAAFISSGIGITPFRSMCRYVLDKKLSSKITLINSSRQALYKDDLAKFSRAGIKVFTTPEPITIHTIADEVDDFSKTTYYLCGQTAFVSELASELLKKGLAKEQLRTEKWGDIQI